MAKTREAHSFRLPVRKTSLPPTGTSTPGVAVAASLRSVAARPSTSAVASLAPAAVQGAAAADAEGSSSVAPAQRRYHTRVGPLRLLHRIPGQPGGPHPLRGLGLQAPGSRTPRDLERHPHHLIRALPEPHTYPLHPLSGGLTSLAVPSWGMLTAEGEISTGRFTTISRHFPRTQSSETPCSSCRDTIWSRL